MREDIQLTRNALHEKLYALIELGYDATAAYSVAIRRLKDQQLKSMFDEFRCDHMRHTYVLGRKLRDLGSSPPTGLDPRPILEHGHKFISELANDFDVLDAMDHNERTTFRAYADALLDCHFTAGVATVLRQNLDDERRHGTWIRYQLSQHTSATVPVARTSSTPPVPMAEPAATPLDGMRRAAVTYDHRLHLCSDGDAASCFEGRSVCASNGLMSSARISDAQSANGR